MKSKLVFLALVMLSITFITPANTTAESQTLIPHQTPNVAVLVNDITGEKYELPVVTTLRLDMGQGIYISEYQVEIPTAILLGSEYVEIGKPDDTHSALVKIYQNFSQIFVRGTEWVAVSFYKGSFEMLDPVVRCTKLEVKAECSGEFLDGGICDKIENKVWNYPTNGQWYTNTPSWSGRFVQVSEAGTFQGGKTIVTLKRGSTTWTFTLSLINQGQWGD